VCWDNDGTGIVIRANSAQLAPLLKNCGLGSYHVFQKNLCLYFSQMNGVYSNKFFTKGQPGMLSNIKTLKVPKGKGKGKGKNVIPPPQSFDKAYEPQKVAPQYSTSYTEGTLYTEGNAPGNFQEQMAPFSTADAPSKTQNYSVISSGYTSQAENLNSLSTTNDITNNATESITGMNNFTSVCENFSTMSDSNTSYTAPAADYSVGCDDPWMNEFNGLMDDTSFNNMSVEDILGEESAEAGSAKKAESAISNDSMCDMDVDLDQLINDLDDFPAEDTLAPMAPLSPGNISASSSGAASAPSSPPSACQASPTHVESPARNESLTIGVPAQALPNLPIAVAFSATAAFTEQLPEAQVSSPPTAFAMPPYAASYGGVSHRGKPVATAVPVQHYSPGLGTAGDFDYIGAHAAHGAAADDFAGDFDLLSSLGDEANALSSGRTNSGSMGGFDPTRPLEQTLMHRTSSGGVLLGESAKRDLRAKACKRPYMVYQGTDSYTDNAKRLKSGMGDPMSFQAGSWKILQTKIVNAAQFADAQTPSPRLVSLLHHPTDGIGANTRDWVDAAQPS
jgi:hypothetical protein